MQYVPIVVTIVFFLVLTKDAIRLGMRILLGREWWGVLAFAALSQLCGPLLRVSRISLSEFITTLGLAVLLYYCVAWGRRHWLESGESDVPLGLRVPLSARNLVWVGGGSILATIYSVLVYRAAGVALGSVQQPVTLGRALVLLVLTVGLAIAEEIASRYYVQGWLNHQLHVLRWKRPVACAIAALAFAALHVDRDRQIVRWLQVFPLGVFFGYLFLRGGLVLSVSAHALTNVCVYAYIILITGHVN